MTGVQTCALPISEEHGVDVDEVGAEQLGPASRVALEMVRESFRLCQARKVEERLAVYAAGGTSCKDMSEKTLAKSRFRVWKALTAVKQQPPPPAE